MNPLSLEIKLGILAAIVIAFAAVTFAAHHYHVLYEAEHAAFTGFKDQVKALGEQAQKHADEVKAKDDKAKETADANHQKELDAVHAGWAATRADLAGVRKQLADTRGRPVPAVTIGAGLACDKASNDRISAAVSKYVEAARRSLDECRAAALDFRDSVAGQLEQADANTGALINGVEWAAKVATPAPAAPAAAPKTFLQRLFGK